MNKTHLSMTVNSWSVEWNSDGRHRLQPCALKIECRGQLVRGQAVFSENGRIALVEGRTAPSCCAACATAYVMREGMKGTITIKQAADLIGGIAGIAQANPEPSR